MRMSPAKGARRRESGGVERGWLVKSQGDLMQNLYHRVHHFFNKTSRCQLLLAFVLQNARAIAAEKQGGCVSLALGGRTPAVQLSTYSIFVDSTLRLSMSRSSGVMASSPLSPAAAEAAAARDRMKPSR